MPEVIDFLDIIVQEMRRQNWTQTDLAEASSTHYVTVNRFVNGRRRVSHDILARLLTALDISVAPQEPTRDGGPTQRMVSAKSRLTAYMPQ